MGHHSYLLCTVLSLAVGISCAHMPLDTTRGWSANKSRNAVVYSDTSSAHLWWQEGIEEAFDAYRGSFFIGLKMPPVEAIYLQRELGPIFRVKGIFSNPPRSWTIAYLPTKGQIGKAGLVILEDANRTRSRRAAAEQVAFHFIAYAMPKAPLWFQVGMAHYLAEHRIYTRGNERLTCFGTPCGPVHLVQEDRGSQNLVNKQPADVLMGITEMFATDWQTYNEKWAYWFDNTAYIFINYLIHGNDGGQASQFGKLMQALTQGKETLEAFRTAYPNLDINTLDAQVQAHRVGKSCALAQFPTVPQGACFELPVADRTATNPVRTPIAEGEMKMLFTSLAQLPLLEKYSTWYPTAIIDHYTRGTNAAPRATGLRAIKRNPAVYASGEPCP